MNTRTYPATFEIATQDELTGLANHVYFRDRLTREFIPSAKASDTPLALALLDVDSFGEYNQQQGHAAGDALLKKIAEMLRVHLGENVFLARWSGDEFAAIFPDTRLDEAFTRLEDLRRDVAAGFKEEGDQAQHVTLSVGVAALGADADDAVLLMRKADMALFTAKDGGRNRVCLPIADNRMVTKTSHYTRTQLDKLKALAKTLGRDEATLLREALDDLLYKYRDPNDAGDARL